MSNPGVDTFHPEYERAYYSWLTTRDAIDGETKIKSRKEHYLPMPSAMAMSEFSGNAPAVSRQNYGMLDERTLNLAQQNPNWHGNKPYQAYLTRAQFPEITSFVLGGLLGLATKDMPSVTLPKNLEYLRENATPTGMSLNELYLHFLVEVLTTGRVGGVIGINEETGWPFIIPYSSERIINWKTKRTANSNKTNARFIVFEERVDADKVNLGNSIFSHDQKSQYFVNTITEEGVYVVQQYDENGSLVNESFPTFRGVPRFEVPFYPIGSVTNSLHVDPNPLYKVASTALQIYMRSADLGNSQFLSCNPTLVLTGVDPDQAPIALGSTVTLCLPDATSNAFYPKTDTSALAHVANYIDDLFEQAIYYGAQLLDSSKKAAESAETVRLKQASSSATLSGIVHNVSMAMQSMLMDIARWTGEDPQKIKFEPVKEFMAPALTAQEQKAMVESWTQGAISKFTLLDNFRRAGLLPAGSSVEEELDRIANEEPEEDPDDDTPPRVNENEEDDDNATD